MTGNGDGNAESSGDMQANWPMLVPDEAQPWQTLESRELVPGPRSVVLDRVDMGGGLEGHYQYRPRGPRAIFVLPITAQGEGVLIRQYRYPLRATVWEVVAGGVERGENLHAAAVRELREEVGGVAAQWVALPGFYPQPSISGVIFYPWLALGVELGDTAHEETEVIERVVLPLTEIYALLDAGQILDGPSSLTLWHARRLLQERGLL